METSNEKMAIMEALNRIHSRRQELRCEGGEIVKAIRLGRHPSAEEIREWRKRNAEEEAEYQTWRERLHALMESETESKPKRSKHTPPADEPRPDGPRPGDLVDGGQFRKRLW